MINVGNKDNIREKYKQIRLNIINKKEKSSIIFNKLIMLDVYKNSKVIAIYKNLNSEVDTNNLIEYSLKNNKKVLLPRIVNDEIRFYTIAADEELIKSNFGVYEPLENNNKLYSKNDINLIIIPGISFDKEKNRIGFGKGYYDKYLKNKNIYKIGLCFDEQIADKLPCSENDIKMDIVITDKYLYM